MKIITIIAVVICFGSLISASEESIIAYPVPFNPGTTSLTIADKSSSFTGVPIRINIDIFDICGDKIFNGSYNSFPVLWKGYSSGGKRVSNGLYIVKVTVENLSTGSIEKKVIRILVKK
ncbi:MAG: hypothetical protein JXK07_02285 [Spirochaetes bacterium]|nr:hypothetical protein [Spirochaetota bacterium]MBN2771882.1 hypothetical protein [Spirochaetota bacterium]HRX16235.1 hypothetical protein [Spirochaetota bacterium]